MKLKSLFFCLYICFGVHAFRGKKLLLVQSLCLLQTNTIPRGFNLILQGNRAPQCKYIKTDCLPSTCADYYIKSLIHCFSPDIFTPHQVNQRFILTKPDLVIVGTVKTQNKIVKVRFTLSISVDLSF